MFKLLLVLSMVAFATTPDPCKTDAADLGRSESTDAYVRTIAKLAEGGKLSADALRSILESDGNPADFASGLNNTARHVWRTAFARQMNEVDFNRQDVNAALARLALARERLEKRQEHAVHETSRVVRPAFVREISRTPFDERSYVSVTPIGDKPYLFWRDVSGLKVFDLESGASVIHSPEFIGRETVTEPQSDGTTLVLSATRNNPVHFHRQTNAGLKNIRESLPPVFEMRTSEAGPIALGPYVASYQLANPYARNPAKPAVMWFKMADGKRAKVHSVEVEEIDTGGEMAAIHHGAHSFLALSSAKSGELTFVDANAGIVHWKPALQAQRLSPPVFYPAGDGVRAVVSTGKHIWVGDPVTKTELARVPMLSAGETPLVIERFGKHYALVPNETAILAVDLDTGTRISPLQSVGYIRSLQAATLGNDHYLVWMEGPEIVIADFASRIIYLRSRVGEDADFHLYRKGDGLHAIVRIDGQRLKDYRLVSEKGREQ